MDSLGVLIGVLLEKFNYPCGGVGFPPFLWSNPFSLHPSSLSSKWRLLPGKLLLLEVDDVADIPSCSVPTAEVSFISFVWGWGGRQGGI